MGDISAARVDTFGLDDHGGGEVFIHDKAAAFFTFSCVVDGKERSKERPGETFGRRETIGIEFDENGRSLQAA